MTALRTTAVPTSFFTAAQESGTRMLLTESSTFFGNGHRVQRLFDDACDEAIPVRWPNGTVVNFFFSRDEFSGPAGDQELAANVFVPDATNPEVQRFGVADVELHLINT
jgi:hypothetical protein